MTDYQSMYHKLFNEVSDTIDKLTKALNDVEDIYIDTTEDEEKEDD